MELMNNTTFTATVGNYYQFAWVTVPGSTNQTTQALPLVVPLGGIYQVDNVFPDTNLISGTLRVMNMEGPGFQNDRYVYQADYSNFIPVNIQREDPFEVTLGNLKFHYSNVVTQGGVSFHTIFHIRKIQ